jgi:signal peptidase I
VLAAFAGYVGAWYLGAIEGNFALLLFLATVVTGVYWLAERFVFLPRRRRAAQALEDAAAQRRAELDRMGIQKVDGDVEEAKGRILMQPWWLDWTAGLFPVIAVVFLLRSFLFEPFKIPSGSMIPTLLVGDLILVNKFTYGVRLPVVNTKITQGNSPQRGDVMVFRYPPQPSMDYIKRVVGVPGDEVAYLNKRLTVNGKPVETTALPDFFDQDAMRYFKQFDEQLGEHRHRILNTPEVPAFVQSASQFKFRENCRYSVEGVSCKVPEGHYFMMGDNRDNSLDSRYWGFVPDENIVGKAFFVWMNFGNLKRIGSFN